MEKHSTDQEKFWAGEFGDEYSQRNRGMDWVASNTMLFARIFQKTGPVSSVIEFGANIGLNLEAIGRLLPKAKLSAVEINRTAVTELQKLPDISVHQQSILDFTPDRQHELALIKGVLIHIAPERLADVYDRLYAATSRFICLAEYYNPSPVEVSYRGHAGKLFKRDFAGELLDRFSDLRLAGYGFAYHRDCFPQDDITWFLLEKTK